jgi:hypothetical protein
MTRTRRPPETCRPGPQPYSVVWERLADQVARDYCPELYPCGQCRRPVVRGYCCTFCGCSSLEQRTEDVPCPE